MIETFRDMKHKSGSHENLTLERTANKILHRMEDKASEDSLEGTRARILGTSWLSLRDGLLTPQRTLERSTARTDVST